MKLSQENLDIANELRKTVQARTETISDGEGVAMFLLWGFLKDHAKIQSIEINALARAQLESFISNTSNNLSAPGDGQPRG
jgi:hypothetical protein